jgi:hypothetical protein
VPYLFIVANKFNKIGIRERKGIILVTTTMGGGYKALHFI